MNILQLGRLLSAFCSEQDGVTAIEYALLAALIVIAIIVSVTAVGVEVGNLFAKIAAIFPLVM